jgi:hypothetical protein
VEVTQAQEIAATAEAAAVWDSVNLHVKDVEA